MEKLKPSGFVSFLGQQVKEKAGYIMCSIGENPRTGYLDLSVSESKCKSGWKKNGWYFTQYSGNQRVKALYWREHAKRVFDCQGLSDGYVEMMTGKKVDTRARYNYANWCTTKGSGMIPAKYRVPGAAVFWGTTASEIHHVAYLEKPVKDGDWSGDWYIVEARGVMVGCVRSTLYSRKPNWYGLMEKYFDYSEYFDKKPKEDTTVYTLGSRALKKGMSGEDVKQLQEALISIGYDLTADGVYGDKTAKAVYDFKKANDVRTSSGEVNDTYGSRAHDALMKVLSDNEEPEPSEPLKTKTVLVYAAGSWNVRSGPGTEYGIVTVVKKGASFWYVSTADNGWIQVEVNGQYGWLSPKCAEVTG